MITCKNKFGLKETQRELFFPACLFFLRAYCISSVGWGLCAGVCLCLSPPSFLSRPQACFPPPHPSILATDQWRVTFSATPPPQSFTSHFPSPGAALGRDFRREPGLQLCLESVETLELVQRQESCSVWRWARTLQEGSGRAARTGQGHLLLLGASPASPGPEGP